ncbi:hypothetical protein [Kitasatospora sp. NPDC085879]|uniref:hypothetical protein n=1 Tax=Kitasatospora sp. NPDC085879 TaxID=3154769 RepID=UPI000BB0F759|nr:hypothetical protein [Streptomyces sp. TLI_235]PBC71228.1 hypothetical protein BX265_5825 [Streptomyces sp. TLI_235]
MDQHAMSGGTQPAVPAKGAVAAAGEPHWPMEPRFRQKPKPMDRIREIFLGVSSSAVVFLLSLTTGLIMVEVQVDSNWMTAFCALVWAITFLALIGWFLGHRGGDQAPVGRMQTA